MDLISWQEITRRLLFAFILGSAVAVEKRWYQTKHFILSSIQMALGAAMFSILASLTAETKFSSFSSQLILGVSVICAGFFFQQPERLFPFQNLNIITKLWCAGAAGALVGYGLFVPAYISILLIFFTNLLFPTVEKDLEKDFLPNLEKELNLDRDLKSKTELKLATKPITQEICYQCQVNCLAADEAAVLALLVQLGKEQKLILTKVSSRNLVKDKTLPEIEVKVDFISHINNSPLQLQQMLISLKSKLEVNSASWLNLSPELSSKNEQIYLEN
ncbi:MAG: MgtC/SapB family protein [Waterburya sp.]